MRQKAVISGATGLPYQRRPEGVTTGLLLRDVLLALLGQTGLIRDQIDGLAISSFTLRPDKAIDIAWRFGLRPRWIMDDQNGGASGLNMLQHAIRAVESGDANAIAILAADHFSGADFVDLNNNYSRTVRDHLSPLQFSGPNSLFAILTSQMMDRDGLERSDFGTLCIAQRQWAAGNPRAAYRQPLAMDVYRSAKRVAGPLSVFDCVPVVSGAEAILVSREGLLRGIPSVKVRSLKALHNFDRHEGNGLTTGLSVIAPELWAESGLEPSDIDVVQCYDDYPVMVMVQLRDLGFVRDVPLRDFIKDRIATHALPVNTSGGQLSAGQPGAAGGLHGLVEAVTQLAGRGGDRQVAGARRALVSGYGMMEYRYCLCANAVILESGA
ncbi:thiolase family protein [Mesorhizobium sp. M0659]|uniref:thiolase family protein n=1 Tax=Mesorhizobium sp. M0659 TaxID=2956980 RepID=UPI00333D8743